MLLLGAQLVIGLAAWLTWLARQEAAGGAQAIWTWVGLCTAWWVTYAALRLGQVRGDPLLLPLACLLSGLGWVEIYRLDPSLGLKQAVWIGLGCAVLIVICLLLHDYRVLEDYRYLYLGLGIALQLGVMLLGVERNGARLWFAVGGLLFQPVEVVKILIILFLASFLRHFRSWMGYGLTSREGHLPRRALLLLGIGWAVAEGVLVLQRDLGMALLFYGLFLSLFYIATGRLDVVALALVLFWGGAWAGYHLFAHVRVRFQAWMDPFEFPETGGYQIVQALFSLAAGGVWGTGLGMGQPNLVPEAPTDFIFVALCEELGLVGGVALLAVLMILVARVFRASLRSHDDFGTLLAAGLGFLLAWQSLILIGGTVKSIPMTGVTLPFVSYGGSSMLANFVVLALMQRLSRGD